VCEHQAIYDRQRHQDGDPANRKNANLDDRVAGERKIIQPLHAVSKSPRRRSRALHRFEPRDGKTRVVNTLVRVRSSVDPGNPRRV
jgi:hypothetical protein